MGKAGVSWTWTWTWTWWWASLSLQTHASPRGTLDLVTLVPASKSFKESPRYLLQFQAAKPAPLPRKARCAQ